MNSKKHIAAGFTLTEVLLALGIFTVGFSMMAMSLPIAALMQKKTADRIFSDMTKGQSAAIINSTELRLGAWTNGQGESYLGIDDKNVFPIPTDDPALTEEDLNINENLRLHAFPSFADSAVTDEQKRTFGLLMVPEVRKYPMGDPTPRLYWVPLIRRSYITRDSTYNSWLNDPNHTWRTEANEWQIIVAILRHRSQARYARDQNPGAWAYKTSETDIDPDPDMDPHDSTPWQGSSNIPGLVRVDCQVAGENNRFNFVNDFHGTGDPDVRFGHYVIDDQGGIYQVKEAGTDYVVVFGVITDPEVNALWYAPGSAGGGSSPIMDVYSLTSNSLNRLITDNKIGVVGS